MYKRQAEALNLIRNAKRPIVIPGGRLHGPGLADLQRFAEEFNLPVAVPQRRFHAFDSKHKNAGGRLPNRANKALLDELKDSDLVLVIGERMLPSMTQNFSFPKAPVADQPFIHVWPDAEEVGRAYSPTLGIAAEPRVFLQAMLDAGPGDVPPSRSGWVEKLNGLHKENMTWRGKSSNCLLYTSPSPRD